MDQTRHCLSGRHELHPVRPRSARPDPVRCGCGCQKLVQPTIGPRSCKPLEVWACPSSLRAPHSTPNTPPCAGPLLLQRTGDRHSGSLTYRLHITPSTVRRSATSARSSEGARQVPADTSSQGHVIVIRRFRASIVCPVQHSSIQNHNPEFPV